MVGGPLNPSILILKKLSVMPFIFYIFIIEFTIKQLH